MYAIACAFLKGSSPCRRIFLLGIAHPVVGPPFQVQGVYRETVLRRGHVYEEGRLVALIYVKRIVIKFFWTIV